MFPSFWGPGGGGAPARERIALGAFWDTIDSNGAVPAPPGHGRGADLVKAVAVDLTISAAGYGLYLCCRGLAN